MKELIFVTSNKGKAEEAQAILGFPLLIENVELEEIQDLDIEVIARKKAEAAYQIIKKPLIVDDVGVYVDAWKGFPGPFIKYLQKIGLDICLRMLSAETNRKAIVKAAVAYHDGKKVHTFVGEIEGTIATEIKGDKGFGWDPLFIPLGSDKTYSEMSDNEKNSLSHRRRALDKFKIFLENDN